MTTIRERDAAWDNHNRLAPMADRHTLLAAGDALAEAVRHPVAPHQPADWTGPCPLCAALTAWKAATG